MKKGKGAYFSDIIFPVDYHMVLQFLYPSSAERWGAEVSHDRLLRKVRRERAFQLAVTH